IGLQDGEDAETKTFNQTPQDMLRAVPGVTGKGLARLVIEMENVRAVADADEEILADMIGKEAARQIRFFFDRSVWDEGAPED
ncbi:DNA repair protein RAD16, partial [Oleoguttula sp. CCFEE 5521]